jgi:hypothetical protein
MTLAIEGLSIRFCIIFIYLWSGPYVAFSFSGACSVWVAFAANLQYIFYKLIAFLLLWELIFC